MHNLPRSEKNEAYTLIELIVTLSIMLIVSSLMYTIYLGSVRGLDRWQKRISLENQGHLVLIRIASDVRDGISLEHPSDSTWHILHNDERWTYRFTNRRLLRGRDTLISAGLQAFEIAIPASNNAHNDFQPPISIQLALHAKNDSLNLATTIYPRAPFSWAPLSQNPDS